jgi:hypothetical protein
VPEPEHLPADHGARERQHVSRPAPTTPTTTATARRTSRTRAGSPPC